MTYKTLTQFGTGCRCLSLLGVEQAGLDKFCQLHISLRKTFRFIEPDALIVQSNISHVAFSKRREQQKSGRSSVVLLVISD